MKKRLDLKIDFKIEYIPLPPELVEPRRAALLMLLQWFKEDIAKEEKESEAKCETK